MLKAAAFLRLDFMTAVSYRIQTLFSLVGLLGTAIPLYFITRALQPVMAGPIRGEGHDYFEFVLLGVVALQFVQAAVFALPSTLLAALRTGTLEALFVTPIRMTTLLAGMMLYPLLWASAKAVVLLAVGWILGVRYTGDTLLPAALIVSLIALVYAPFSIMGGALILLYRTSGPFLIGVLTVSTLLGGVYFPTRIVPSWLGSLSSVIPLTYGLHALRRVALEGVPFMRVSYDIATLLAFTLFLMSTASAIWLAAVRHAQRSGTLAQY
jgi:ABC-2 type transport system permease protein